MSDKWRFRHGNDSWFERGAGDDFEIMDDEEAERRINLHDELVAALKVLDCKLLPRIGSPRSHTEDCTRCRVLAKASGGSNA